MNKYELAGQDLVNRYGVTVRKYRGSMSGVAFLDSGEIAAPKPVRPLSFAIFAHEVGHIANGEIRPRLIEELRAWQFALNTFREYGLPIPKVVRDRMSRSMSYALAKALNRGLKKIPPEFRKYKKYLVPVTYLYGDGHTEQKWRGC